MFDESALAPPPPPSTLPPFPDVSALPLTLTSLPVEGLPKIPKSDSAPLPTHHSRLLISPTPTFPQSDVPPPPQFSSRMQALPADPQILFLRVFLRTHPWVKLNALSYVECPDMPASMTILCEAGLAVDLASEPRAA